MRPNARVVLMMGWMLAGGMANAAERPNVVFIYTDDQAPTAIGLVNSQLKTPHIDSLFKDGARLANAFVTTPVCSPARATLMTSRYGSELGIFDWLNGRVEPHAGLDPDMPTWPKLLHAAGYSTGFVGKWHLGQEPQFHPTRNGYDYFMGFLGGGTSPKNPTQEKDGITRKFEGFTADLLADHALEYVRRHQAEPFLLSLHFRAPHAAWLPVRDEDWDPYKELDPTIPNPDYPKLDVKKIKRMTREYYASVASVDRNVGRVLRLLDDLNMTERTIVVFTSDHGYNLGHHGVWYKGNAIWQLTELPAKRWEFIPRSRRPNLWDQSLRVPAAVRWPAVIKPGTVITETISSMDWFPTILAMTSTNMPAAARIHGRNFLPLLRGERIHWENDLYAEYSMKHGARTAMRCWRTPEWKLMIDFVNRGRAELYNLKDDPLEMTNLIESTDPVALRAKRELRDRIVQRMREIGDPAGDDWEGEGVDN